MTDIISVRSSATGVEFRDIAFIDRKFQDYLARYNAQNEKSIAAYLIHEECWRLLMKHFDEENLCLDRLFAVLGEMPKAVYPWL